VATTKKAGGSGRYRVLRDFGGNVEGDVIELTDEAAADLLRDGMVAPEQED
jgi:hypothetical protein